MNALTEAIETDTKRIGDLGVEIVAMKEDLSDSEKGLIEDKKFLAELEKSCATKTGEWEVICKTRSEELLALADTIKILNDDDALELFKKTLPGASSFIQLEVTQASMREEAAAALTRFRNSQKSGRQNVNFILLALQNKKVDFNKVIKMVDDMVVLLKSEQVDDNDKKEYCVQQFDTADDKKKELERKDGQLVVAIDDATEQITTLGNEIKVLGVAIADLDKLVAEATENRMEENSDFKALQASDSAAKEILAFAKNRLNKFYNPKLYKEPGFAQIRVHGAPPPPPETAGPYQKKSESSNGVIGMIDTLIAELDKELTESETSEKLAQEDYEQLMADSTEKRGADSKSAADKAAAKGDLETKLTDFKDEKTVTVKTLMAVEEFISQLHSECDWLIQYFDVRKEARAGEIDALGKAKAVLSGADFSFVQMKSTRFLRKA